MNNKFTLNANGIKKDAEMIVKFNLENKDYLIYCTDENESNKQVFVSKLTLNSEGKYFIDDITSEEKNKLSGVVYNIVILTPNEAKKGVESKTLIDKLTNENKVMLSVEMPILNEQSYYSNCSIAITSKLLVEEAINFFKANLTSKSEEQKLNNEVRKLGININQISANLNYAKKHGGMNDVINQVYSNYDYSDKILFLTMDIDKLIEKVAKASGD